MRIALVAQNGSPLAPAPSQEPMSQAASVAAHARELAKLGHRVTIYARRDARALPDSAILAPRVTVEHVTAGPPAPLSGAELAANIADFSDQLLPRWRKNPPSLVHAFFWTSGLAAATAARGHGIPLVQTFGTLGVAERRNGSQRRRRAGQLQYGSCRPDQHGRAPDIGNRRPARCGHGRVRPRRPGRQARQAPATARGDHPGGAPGP